MAAEQEALVWREKRELAREPCGDQEDGERREECDVGDHREASSNAWSTRKYAICRPSGLTRTKSLGTWSLSTKSICATCVCRLRSVRVPGEYKTFWNVTAALNGGAESWLRLTL